jgi:hypothetical protein
MRRLPSTRVLPWIFTLALLGLAATSARPGAPPSQQGAKANKSAPAVKKEDLRYDGKPFSYWRHYWRTELKAECRIDFLRAMAAFGVNGHAEEATTAIVELVSSYDKEAFEEPSSREPTLDQKVIGEAVTAVEKIGPHAAPVLLRNLSSPAGRTFADRTCIFGPLSSKEVPDSVVPTLLGLIQSDNREIRSLAFYILAGSTGSRSEIKAKLLVTIRDRSIAKAAFSSLSIALKSSDSYGEKWRAAEILKVVGRRGKELLPVVIEVLNAEAIRCKEEAAKPQPYYFLRKDDGSYEKMTVPKRGVGLMGFAEPLIEWLGDLGLRAKTAAPALTELFDLTDDAGRAAITKTLAQIGARVPKAPSPLDGAFLNAPRDLQRAMTSGCGRITDFFTAR